ncbi:hypothetical protein [Streptomyces sp. NPDC014894]|uniref:hypothetical protein n=1 Tax=Streptomyces sp. NPDC014894 TaxID=3364931 RepID=UPI0036FAD794
MTAEVGAMALSTRGIARQYLGVTGRIGVRSALLGISAVQGGALRQRLVSLARQDIAFARSECVFGWNVAYQQTWSSIWVRVRLNPDAGITAATMTTLRTTWENGIRAAWNNRWGLGRAGEGTCPLEIGVDWVTVDPHQTVRVRTGPGRTDMGTWDTQDTGNVIGHEFGHMLGHPDEYTDANCPARNPVNTGTVMDTNSTTVPQRMMTAFANNVGSQVVAL